MSLYDSKADIQLAGFTIKRLRSPLDHHVRYAVMTPSGVELQRTISRPGIDDCIGALRNRRNGNTGEAISQDEYRDLLEKALAYKQSGAGRPIITRKARAAFHP